MSSARDRIRTDLARSITDLTSRGLPRPRLFAYPLSEAEDHGDDATQHFVTDLVHRTFTAAMLNLPPAAPLSRREAATGLLHRLEVTAADTPDTVLDNLLPLANLATADVSGLADRRSWIGSDGLPAQVSISRGTVTFDHGGTYAYAAYAPAVTADWTGYTASVRVSGLEPRPGSAVSGALSVRVGSAAELRVNVSRRFVQIHTGNAGKPVPVVARSLPAAPHHLITVHAGADTTKVSVDGKVVYQGPVSATPSSGGGFALSASRAKPDAPFAEFAALAVRPDR